MKSESSAHGPALVHRRGSLRGTLVALQGKRVSIGRDQGSDVVAGSGVVSSRHALLVFDDLIATAGSCFAQNISLYLQGASLRFQQMLPVPRCIAPRMARQFEYGLYSAPHGNITSS